MIPFKLFFEKRRLKKRRKPVRRGTTLSPDYQNSKHYSNLPPYGTPPNISSFPDTAYPTFPTG